MRFDAEDEEGAYARWVLEAAQVRAIARRQLAFSIPIVIAGFFVAIISTFSFAHTTPMPPNRVHAPISAPAHHHAVMLG